MKKGVGLLILVGFLMFLSSVYAVEFNGTVYDLYGSPLNGSVINVTVRDMDFSIIGYNSTTTNGSGWFNLTLPDNSSWMFEPNIMHFNGSYVQYIGQKLPAFPGQVIEQVSGADFFLREAGTLNITAVNSTGAPVYFNYQVKDQKLGYVIADNLMGADGGQSQMVSSAVLKVPKDRNYSIMIFPNASMPTMFNWNNFSSNISYSFGISSYNATTRTLNKVFNLTMGHARVTGYIKVDGISGWDELNVIAYLLEPGEMVHARFGALPHNLSSFFEGNSDVYNLSTGIENYSGFYNISLPSTVEFSQMVLFATARKGSNYYGGFQNLSLDYNSYPNGENYPLNFTYMFGLFGSPGNISLEDPMGPGEKNVTTKLKQFRFVNSSNSTLSNVNMHIEAKVDYSSYGVIPFTWMADVTQGGTPLISIPLLNVSGIEEFNVFAEGGDYAPLGDSFSPSEIPSLENITVRSFSPRDLDGQSQSSSITVTLYTSNSTCDVPNPPSSCIVGGGPKDMDTFNPIQAVMGGGKLSIRMGVGSILIHYVNVDILASGPPDSDFESNAEEVTSGEFSKAMRFGSAGPKIYDYVLVSIPYTEGSDTTTGLNESAEVNLSIPRFYDEDWNLLWNASVNGTNASHLAGNFSHYKERKDEWQTLLSGITCVDTLSSFNSTNPCYIDKSNNRVWARIPHFSGTEPSVTGNVITASGGNNNNGGSSGGGSTGSSGGGSTSSGSNKTTYKPSEKELKDGYDVSVGIGSKVQMKILNATHTLEVKEIKGEKVKVTISSEPITLELSKGETKKVDLNNDSVYDLSVYLKNIASSKARFVLTLINESYERKSGEEKKEEEKGKSPEKKTIESKPSSLGAFEIISLIVIVLAAALWVFYIVKSKSERKKELEAEAAGKVQQQKAGKNLKR